MSELSPEVLTGLLTGTGGIGTGVVSLYLIQLLTRRMQGNGGGEGRDLKALREKIERLEKSTPDANRGDAEGKEIRKLGEKIERLEGAINNLSRMDVAINTLAANVQQQTAAFQMLLIKLNGGGR